MKQTKTGDFFIGFLGIVILDAMIYAALGRDGTAAWVFLTIVINLVLYLATLSMRRPFIGLGIVATIVIPIFAFGACVVDVMRYGFH